jgi:general secretion pathway protein F
MRYVVRALDPGQQLHTLVLDALDEQDARRQALQQSLSPLSVTARRALRSRDARFDLLLFAQELLALVAAGLSVIETLDTLVDKEPLPARRAVLQRLAQQLREGERLSAALRAQPQVFPPLFVGVVQAAEGTSDLPRALRRWLDYETRLQAVRHKVVSAAIYPAILLGVGLGVSLFLLAYVVPRFAAVYQGSGRPIPFASQLLLQWGTFASQHAPSLLAALGIAAVVCSVAARRAIATGGWWRVMGALPGARARVEILALSRLYLTLGMLLEGGIALHRAISLAAAVVDQERRARLARTQAAIEAGEPLSAALERERLSTPVALRLLRVGEQSGQLGAMLTRTAGFHDEAVSRAVERFSKAFEPALMAAIGLVIGGIVILLYMPIFDLAGSLQ